MWHEIAAWQETLALRPDLSTKTIALYTQDARRFATWLQSENPGLKASEITPIDAKAYRDHLLVKRFAPTTINRALISLMLFFDTIGGTNPFRNLTMIEVVEPAPVALSKTEWNAVRRCAEQAARRDHGLALVLATLFRYAGPRVSEVAALQIPDVQVSARRGLLVIRRGKGLKHREVPLVQEAREPLAAYFTHREHLAEQWRERARARGEAVAAWSRWPDGHLFLGQRGPLAERGIREIIAKLGQAENSLHLSALTICAIRLPKHSFIPLPTDWTTLRCRFQPFNDCLAMPILQPQPSTREFLLTTWRV